MTTLALLIVAVLSIAASQLLILRNIILYMREKITPCTLCAFVISILATICNVGIVVYLICLIAQIG